MSSDTSDSNRKYSVPMVAKTLALLEAFRLNGARLSLAEAIELSGIPKASAFRMLETLRSSGYLTKMGNGRYRLTYKFLEMSIVVHQVNPIRRAALSHLRQLQQKTAETVSLGVLQEDHIVYLDVLEGTPGSRRAPSTGSVAALHATAVGKAVAARLPEDQLDRIIRQGLPRLTPNTIVTRSALRSELGRVRERGYATEIEEEAIGWVSAAATIRDDNSSASYAISISGPTTRVIPARVSQFGEAVNDVCRKVQHACGLTRGACRVGSIPAPMRRPWQLEEADVG